MARKRAIRTKHHTHYLFEIRYLRFNIFNPVPKAPFGIWNFIIWDFLIYNFPLYAFPCKILFQ
jgi:hypothetical protein